MFFWVVMREDAVIVKVIPVIPVKLHDHIPKWTYCSTDPRRKWAERPPLRGPAVPEEAWQFLHPPAPKR